MYNGTDTPAWRPVPGNRLAFLPLAGLLLAGLLLAVPARAAFQTLESAYELTPAELRLPAGATGSLTVRPCRSCPLQALRTSARTTWRIGARGPLVTAAEFATRFKAAGTGDGTMVFVYYQPRTREVNRVVLVPGGGAP